VAALDAVYPDKNQQQILGQLAALLDAQSPDPAELARFHTLMVQLAGTEPATVGPEDSGPQTMLTEDPQVLAQRFAAALDDAAGPGAGQAADQGGAADIGGAADLGGGADLGGAGGDGQGAAGFGAITGRLWNGMKEALRQLTYFQMKDRAGTVGQHGLGPFLGDLAARSAGLRVHLVGHSFGGRLVTAVAEGPDGQPGVTVDTLTLLQAAFSHNGFAAKFDGARDGAFRAVLTGHKVAGPIVVTHSRNDRAVGVAYPLASRIAGQDAAALGDENDKFGGLGRNGAQHTPERVVGTLQPVGSAYAFEPGKIYNLNADAIIADHSDICHNEVAFALLTAVVAAPA